MTTSRLSQRGAYANQPAKLPGLQGFRLADPQAQRGFEALREWVEVRLGSRGDKYERAVTLREFEKLIAPLEAYVASLGDFDGTAGTLRVTELGALPVGVRQGAFVEVANEVYVGTGAGWKKITLTTP